MCRVGSRAAQGGADGDGLPGADLAGDHPDAVLGDAPADPGDGLAVGGVAVQHAGGEVTAERGAGEPEEPLQPVDHDTTSPSVSRAVGGRVVGEQVELSGTADRCCRRAVLPARAA